MKIEFIGKGIDISYDLKSYVEHKLFTFERHLKEVGEGEVEVVVTFTVEKHRHRHRVDIDVYLKTPGGGTLHAWEERKDGLSKERRSPERRQRVIQRSYPLLSSIL